MAEPIDPTTEETPEGGRHAADAPADAPADGPDTVRNPVAAETIAGNAQRSGPSDDDLDDGRVVPVREEAPVRDEAPVREEVPVPEETAVRERTEPVRADEVSGAHPVAARPVEEQDEDRAEGREPAAPQPIPPAEEHAPPPPAKKGNRLAGTAWVLLASGLFLVVYFGAIALLELVLAGPAAVLPQLGAIISTGSGVFAWLPVLLFLLLFELVVLVFNRAGRFFYVVASLVVGLVLYVFTAWAIPLLISGVSADSNTFGQRLLDPAFVLVGLAAREVMLWTGLAIGSRGIRVRRRNREARRRYDEEVSHGVG